MPFVISKDPIEVDPGTEKDSGFTIGGEVTPEGSPIYDADDILTKAGWRYRKKTTDTDMVQGAIEAAKGLLRGFTKIPDLVRSKGVLGAANNIPEGLIASGQEWVDIVKSAASKNYAVVTGMSEEQDLDRQYDNYRELAERSVEQVKRSRSRVGDFFRAVGLPEQAVPYDESVDQETSDFLSLVLDPTNLIGGGSLKALLRAGKGAKVAAAGGKVAVAGEKALQAAEKVSAEVAEKTAKGLPPIGDGPAPINFIEAPSAAVIGDVGKGVENVGKFGTSVGEKLADWQKANPIAAPIASAALAGYGSDWDPLAIIGGAVAPSAIKAGATKLKLAGEAAQVAAVASREGIDVAAKSGIAGEKVSAIAKRLDTPAVNFLLSQSAQLADAVGRGAVIGGGLGYALNNDPEQSGFGSGFGSGIVGGGMGRFQSIGIDQAGRVAFHRPDADGKWVRVSESPAALAKDQDLAISFLASRSLPERTALAGRLNIAELAELARGEAAAKGANRVTGSDMKVRFLDSDGMVAAGFDPTVAKVMQGVTETDQKPTLYVNLDVATDPAYTLWHEGMHGFDRLAPDEVGGKQTDAGAALERTRAELKAFYFGSYDASGKQTSTGKYDGAQFLKLEDQYLSRVGMSEAEMTAHIGQPMSKRAAYIADEMAAEHAGMLGRLSGGDIGKASRYPSTALGRAALGVLARTRIGLESLGIVFDGGGDVVTSGIFKDPTTGKRLELSSDVREKLSAYLRAKDKITTRMSIDFDESPITEVVNARDLAKASTTPETLARWKNSGMFALDDKGEIRMMGGKPVFLTAAERKKVDANRSLAIFTAIKAVPDDGSPGLRSEVIDGVETFKGTKLSKAQVDAVLALPDAVLPPSVKARISELVKLQEVPGGPVFADYNKAITGGRYDSKASISTQIFVPMSLSISAAGNFLVSSFSVVGYERKVAMWKKTKKKFFEPWDGNMDSFHNDVRTYLNNQESGAGNVAVGKEAITKKNAINDFLASVLVGDMNRVSTKSNSDNLIRSFRVDRMQSIERAGGDNMPYDYGKVRANFMPAEAEADSFTISRSDMARFMPSSLTARDINEIAAEVGGGDVKGGAKAFGAFMRSMRDKGITLRDVVKSYGITLSSIQRQELPAETIKRNWPDAPFKDGTKVRPEDAFAQLLGTLEGQRYLDAAESGVFDEQAADTVVQKFRSFGFHNKLKEQMKTAVEQFYPKAQDIIDAVNSMPADEFVDYVRNNFKGISYGKVGFWSGQLGRGDIPTFDSRQGKLIYGKEVPVTKQVLLEQRDRLTQLGIKVSDEFKEFAQTLLHHEVWDRLNDSDTEHGPIKEAMLRFQPADTDYLAAVKAGDMKVVQGMVDEAAKAAGYSPQLFFHGTQRKFTAFNAAANTRNDYGRYGKGFYFTKDKYTAAIYAGRDPFSGKREVDIPKDATIHSVYLDIKRPKTIEAKDIEMPKTAAEAEATTQKLMEEGYDGVIGVVAGKVQSPNTEYVVFSPSQIKSADPITRDSQGNVIPLSKRFNTTSEDIRYQPADGADEVTLSSVRTIDALGNKSASQANPASLKYPQNPVEVSVVLPPRWGFVNKNITGMPRAFADVQDIASRTVDRIKRVVEDSPVFAKESARFYSDMSDSADILADVTQPGVTGLEKALLSELMLRYLSLGSPRTSVTGNATKSSGSAAGYASGHMPGVKLGFGPQQIGARETHKAWQKGQHFDLDMPGIDDKVRSFYINGISESIENLTKAGDDASARELMLRAGKSLHLIEEGVKSLTDADVIEIQRHLDGKVTVDMWDMVAKGFAWPGFILRRSQRNKADQPFQWSQDKFSVDATLGDKRWETVTKDLGVENVADLRYQQARALRVDGNLDWTEKTWAERVKQPFPPETRFTYFTEGSEAGLTPGGAGPMYDAQQGIDGLLADSLNRAGFAPLFGKEKLKARNAQEILWALERLDNPIKKYNALSLFGDSFGPLMQTVNELRLGKGLTKRARAEAVLDAMDRAFAKMATQEMPVEVVTTGTSAYAKLIQNKLDEMTTAGIPKAAEVLTNTVADGLGDWLNDLSTLHNLDFTVDSVNVGFGAYSKGANVSTSPNFRMMMRGNPKHTRLVLEALSVAMDQDEGNIIRMPTVRELNDVNVKKNFFVTFDTRGFDAAKRDALFTDLHSIKDQDGNSFLTGFTETEEGMAIGDQFYRGDMEVQFDANKDKIDAAMKTHGVQDMSIRKLIVDTFRRADKPPAASRFASDVAKILHDKIAGASTSGSFPQRTEALPLLQKRASASISAADNLGKSARDQLFVDLNSAVDVALLLGQIDQKTGLSLKETLKDPKLKDATK